MAFALSLDTQTPHALSIHTTTLFIVLLTVIVMGGAIGPLLLLLDIKPQTGEDEEIEEVPSSFWLRLDRRYIIHNTTRLALHAARFFDLVPYTTQIHQTHVYQEDRSATLPSQRTDGPSVRNHRNGRYGSSPRHGRG